MVADCGLTIIVVADVIAGTPQDAGKTKARMDNFQEYYYEATEVRETDVKISSQWGKVNKMFKQAVRADPGRLVYSNLLPSASGRLC